ncbi:hypothetical protein GOODEAATRI_017566 [Goodea atripinnis]|uniref:Uncharacterized protein n=1 Tax=Goodea atripinnis TaxID=208336 RepID=A0ABV0N3M2_9TELE
MAFLKRVRSPSLSFFQTVVSLLLSTVALTSSFWCTGKQKMPKPLCTATKLTRCIPVPGVSNTSNIQFFWETGDDRFVFPTFHTGLFIICEENIYVDEWAFTVCMAAGVSTLNNYTKKFLMVGPRSSSSLNPCSFNFVGLLPPAPYYTPPNLPITLSAPLSAPLPAPMISHLSPYYELPSAALPLTSPKLTHSHSLPLTHSDSFPLPPSHPAPASPFHRLSLPSPSLSPSISVHMMLPGHKENPLDRDEDYSPL